MKKFLFSALACVAFAGSGFASNEVVLDTKFITNEYLEALNAKVGDCSFSFKVVDNAGNVVETGWMRSTNPVTRGDCSSFVSGAIQKLESEGYTVSEYSMVWTAH